MVDVSNRQGAQVSAAGFDTYIAAFGAAFFSMFLDRTRNNEVSTIRKIGSGLKDVLTLTDITTAYTTAGAFALICGAALLLVYVYRPKERREAFLLGLGVLTTFTISVPPADTPKSSQASTSEQRSGSSPKTGWLMREAYAQDAHSAVDRSKIWIFLEGPEQFRAQETLVSIYGRSGTVTSNWKTNTGIAIELAEGQYQVEIAHPGFRSIAFTIDAKAPAGAYEVRLNSVNIDAISNFFGPTRVHVNNDPDLSNVLASLHAACTRHDQAATNDLLKKIRKKLVRSLERSSRSELCAKDV
jgi:hypothetical protein